MFTFDSPEDEAAHNAYVERHKRLFPIWRQKVAEAEEAEAELFNIPVEELRRRPLDVETHFVIRVYADGHVNGFLDCKAKPDENWRRGADGPENLKACVALATEWLKDPTQDFYALRNRICETLEKAH